MNFKGNRSDKQVIQTRTLYTGLGNYKVVALNPTEEERKALKITQNTSEYTGEDSDGNKQIRLDFWMKLSGLPYVVEDFDKKTVKLPLQKLSIFLTDKELESDKHNKMWMNATGVTTWALSPEVIKDNSKMDWFDSEDLRACIPGEDQLTKFLISLFNVDTRQEDTTCRLDDPKKIAQGKIKELKDLLKGWKDNDIQLLLGIKKVIKGENTSYFQDFFKDFFGRTSIETLEAWKKAITDDRNGLGAERYDNFTVNDLKFSKFKIDTSISGSEDTNSPTTDGGYDSGPDDEDIPF